jgi:hypothetical protein
LITTFFKEKGKEQAQMLNGKYLQLTKDLSFWTNEFMQQKDSSILSTISKLQKQIDQINEYRAGAKLRCKSYNLSLNEKPTKFFFRKAQLKRTKTLIYKLKDKDGNIAMGSALLEVAKRFYKKLYSKKKQIQKLNSNS